MPPKTTKSNRLSAMTAISNDQNGCALMKPVMQPIMLNGRTSGKLERSSKERGRPSAALSSFVRPLVDYLASDRRARR